MFQLLSRPASDTSPFAIPAQCDNGREYQCSNQRCIASYLACDHHNNCGDHSDEDTNCLAKVPTAGPLPPPEPPLPPPTDPYDNRPPYSPYPPPDSYDPSIPTFDIDDNRVDQRPKGDGGESGSGIPEYFDVPLPTQRPLPTYPRVTSPTGGPYYYDTMNGHGAKRGGFLEDLFAFNAKTSNTVHIVRYLLGILVIIIVVTLINFIIWCMVTKRDVSFMAPSSVSPPPPYSLPPPSPSPTPMGDISVITV